MGEPLPNTEPQRAVSPWLRFVLICDRAGSAWYIGLGFFFAPLLTLASPWPALITALWVAIGLAAVWLALLGVATAAGLALAMRSNIDVGEDFWRSIVAYPPAEAVNRTRRAGS
ncbi:hypothetical protein [Mycolicibacterium poriferae]|uniref:hypothetical protein n=1 Tax=Mycolicibacterium poriferae TaxID=39694 RepID=UPI0024B893D1|nr:hypothetical protein [Mycolicibacterium poriferae]